MNAGGLAIVGGLLKGVGAGITADYEAKRQNALLALKRGWETQDAATAARTKAAQNATDYEQKKGLLGVEHGYRVDENAAKAADDRLTVVAKAGVDAKMLEIKGDIDLSHDKAIEALKHNYNLDEITARSLADTQHDLKIAHITPDHYEVGQNGQIVIWKKDGTAFVRGTGGDFVPKGSSEDDGGASITEARNARGASTTSDSGTPAAPAANPKKAQVLAMLGNAYAEAASNPQAAQEMRTKYPGMFNADGSLKPRSELLNLVNQQFPN